MGYGEFLLRVWIIGGPTPRGEVVLECPQKLPAAFLAIGCEHLMFKLAKDSNFGVEAGLERLVKGALEAALAAKRR
jgi:hypothetical protein